MYLLDTLAHARPMRVGQKGRGANAIGQRKEDQIGRERDERELTKGEFRKQCKVQGNCKDDVGMSAQQSGNGRARSTSKRSRWASRNGDEIDRIGICRQEEKEKRVG